MKNSHDYILISVIGNIIIMIGKTMKTFLKTTFCTKNFNSTSWKVVIVGKIGNGVCINIALIVSNYWKHFAHVITYLL